MTLRIDAHCTAAPTLRGRAPHDFSTNANACGPCPTACGRHRSESMRAAIPTRRTARCAQSLARFHGVDARAHRDRGQRERVHRAHHGRGRAAAAAERAWLPATAMATIAAAAARGGCWRLPGPRQALACRSGLVLRPVQPARPAASRGLARESTARCAERLRARSGLRAAAPRRTRWLTGAARPRLATVDAQQGAGPDRHPRGLCDCASRRGMPRSRLVAGSRRRGSLGAHGVRMLAAWTNDDAQAWLAESRARLRVWKGATASAVRIARMDLPAERGQLSSARGPTVPYSSRAEALRGRHQAARHRIFGLPGHVRLACCRRPASARSGLMRCGLAPAQTRCSCGCFANRSAAQSTKARTFALRCRLGG